MKRALVIGLLCVLVVVALGVFVVNGALRIIDEPDEPADAALRERAHALNVKYPFTPTPDGMPLALEVPRLRRFLTIIASLEPEVSRIENFGPVDPHDKAAVDRYFAVETGAVDLWLRALEEQQMSPIEFHSMFGTIEGAAWVTTPGELHATELARLMNKETRLRNDLVDPRHRARAEQELPRVLAALSALQFVEHQRYQQLRDANAAALRAVQAEREKIRRWPNADMLAAYGHALGEQP